MTAGAQRVLFWIGAAIGFVAGALAALFVLPELRSLAIAFVETAGLVAFMAACLFIGSFVP